MEVNLFYCGSTQLNVRRWVEASHIKFEQKLWNDVRDHVTFIYGFIKTLRKNLTKRENYPTPCSGSVKPPRRNKKKLKIKALLLGHGRQDEQTRPSHKTLLYLPHNDHQYLQALSFVEQTSM
jgi:hypothetical protein